MSAPKPPVLSVGAAPHVRRPGGLAWLHAGMLLALVPTAFAGAAGHAFGPKAAAGLPAASGSLSGILNVLSREMGVDAGPLWFFGILGALALSAGFGALAEYVTQVAMRQPYRAIDGHGALTGLLLALVLPPTVPAWVLIVGIVVSVFLAKQLFGGIGGYPMHPAMVGYMVLLLSWPNHVIAVGSASMGAPTPTAVLATAAGGLLLWARGSIRPPITLGVLAGVAVFALAFAGRLPGSFADQFLTGHVVLCAFFIATDPTSSPANQRAMWIYGFGVGFFIVLIRAYGVWPEAAPFAVLLMNVVNPLLDKVRPKPLRAVIPR